MLSLLTRFVVPVVLAVFVVVGQPALAQDNSSCAGALGISSGEKQSPAFSATFSGPGFVDSLQQSWAVGSNASVALRSEADAGCSSCQNHSTCCICYCEQDCTSNCWTWLCIAICVGTAT